ncbi:MAG: hypothetical protein C0521_05405 [Xanthomonas sp.]|nr:hypothetical protein [Xanthomonas sp.]
MRKLVVLLTLLLASGAASELVFGPTNFGVMGYPSHECDKPRRPYQPVDEWEADQYNRRLREYKTCMIEYLDGAQNDMKRIQEKMQEAANDARY